MIRSSAGIPWTVKNLFELKNARRVLIEGNLFENNWVHAQNGTGILFTVRNQGGKAPWCAVQDVTMINNRLRNSPSGFVVMGEDYNHPSQQTPAVPDPQQPLREASRTAASRSRTTRTTSRSTTTRSCRPVTCRSS